MEAIWTALVAALLAAWFGASVVHQISPQWWRHLIERDPMALLPRWNFFAPNPAREDTHVVYREQRDGEWSAWRALTPAAGNRRWRWIWNPERHVRKAASDLANGLRRSLVRFEDAPRAVLLSNSYVGLLHWVMGQPAEPGVTHRQFAVVTSSGFDSNQTLNVLFVSEPHSIGP